MYYDTNREELLAAYHKNALLSISLNVNSQASFNTHYNKFGSYFKESRNLVYVTGNGMNWVNLCKSFIKYIYLKKFRKKI